MNMLIVKSIWALGKTDGLAKKRKHAAGKGFILLPCEDF